MKFQKLSITFFYCIFLLSLNGFPLTLKLGSLAPKDSPWDDGLRRISSGWAKVSNNRVNLKIYPGGIAGGEQDMIRKMKIGQLSAAGITGIGLTRIYSGILAVQLPLTVRTEEELDYVMEKTTPYFEKKLLAKGFKVIAWTKVGWAHFFSKKPVVYPEDLKKQKLFVYKGDPAGNQAWKNAGFHPVPLDVTDMMSALQSGMVEAFTQTPLSAASYQWFGMAKNMCGMKWAPLIGAIVVSKRDWNKIDKELRPVLLSEAEKAAKSMQEEIDEADRQALSVMKEHGLNVTPVPPEAVSKWKSAAKKAFTDLAGKSFDEESYNLVIKTLKEYRKLNEKQ